MLTFRARSWVCYVPAVLTLAAPSFDAFVGTAIAGAVISALRTRYAGEDFSPEGIHIRRLVVPDRRIPVSEIVRVYREPGIFGFVRAELTTGRPPALFNVPKDRVDEINALLGTAAPATG